MSTVRRAGWLRVLAAVNVVVAVVWLIDAALNPRVLAWVLAAAWLLIAIGNAWQARVARRTPERRGRQGARR